MLNMKNQKIRSHDLISMSINYKKFLSKKEQEKLQNLASEIRNGLFGKDFSNQDILATRIGNKIKFEFLFDE
jgi:hypothetical protein